MPLSIVNSDVTPRSYVRSDMSPILIFGVRFSNSNGSWRSTLATFRNLKYLTIVQGLVVLLQITRKTSLMLECDDRMGLESLMSIESSAPNPFLECMRSWHSWLWKPALAALPIVNNPSMRVLHGKKVGRT